jgi:spore maturation protein CgeB
MFKVLGRSYITLNYHIDCAEDYANNMRLYEATGCGALLITDWKKNLGDLFSPDEIVSFDSVNGAVDAISYYLKNKEEGKLIAVNGQKRTLTDHTYNNRMADTAAILEGML